MKHLIIGDAHAKPGVSNDRFALAGELALQERPDVIIDMGDWADMESLSSYDKGKKEFEGRRYKKDIRAAINARLRFNEPIERYNSMRRKNGKKQNRPRKISLLGNHEQRIERVASLHPELDGVLSYDDLGHAELGWERHNFLDVVEVDGVSYSHYFTSGVMGRPIGGEHPAASIIKKKFVSCTAGHAHVRDFTERARPDGTKILGMVAGCFFDHYEPWAGDANLMYWRGLIICHSVVNGEYEPEFISMKMLKDRFE